MPSVVANRGFNDAGEKPGLEIWRVEKLEPVRRPAHEAGQFFSGDAYILLNTKVLPGSNKHQYDLHFWLGKNCSRDEATGVAMLTVELDELVLGGAATQFREVQHHESKLFLSYFKDSMRYLEGGVSSALNTVDPNAFEKRLFQIKGKKNVRVGQVECKCSSLNQGDTFVLDCGRKQYVWIGPKSGKRERSVGLETAKRIRDEERGGKAHISIIEEDWETNEEFFKALGSKDKEVIRSGVGIDDDDVVRKIDQQTVLYMIPPSSGNKKLMPIVVAERPLKHNLLDSKNCYVLESGCAGIFVWMGKQCNMEFKNKVWRSVNDFLEIRGFPAWTAVTKVVDGGETSLFKQYFEGWSDEPLDFTDSSGNGKIAEQDYSGAAGIDVKNLHKKAGKTEEWLPDDGTGKIEVYRIEKQELSPVPEKAYGIFFGNDCYVILYTYIEKGIDKYIIYFWQGLKATTEDKGASAAQAVVIDNKLGGRGIQIRVVAFKEPLHFMKIFKGRLIVFQEGHVTGYQSPRDHFNYDPRQIYMFQVTGSDDDGTVKAIEVPARVASLNSNDIFVILNAKKTGIWFGKHCSEQEQQMARYMGKMLSEEREPPVTIHEGSEPELFWDVLGSREDYYTGPKKIKEGLNIPPRLFHCSMSSGKFLVEEIVRFNQSDLDETDVMILDTYDDIFIWLGDECHEFEKKEAAKIATNYLLSDPSGRTPDNTLIIVVRMGFEPPQFTGCFQAWDSQQWANGKSFKEMCDEVGKENAGISLLEDEKKKYNRCYALDVLQRPFPPEGVDVTKKEMYLSDEDFNKIFKMSKAEYLKFPEWKRNNLRKEHGLF